MHVNLVYTRTYKISDCPEVGSKLIIIAKLFQVVSDKNNTTSDSILQTSFEINAWNEVVRFNSRILLTDSE